jgi:hypothetical protein
MGAYESFANAQDRLAIVTKKISSFDEKVYNDVAAESGIPNQQAELEQLSELFQAFLNVENYYFKKTSGGLWSSLSRGMSMVGRYWGFADHSADSAVAALEDEVSKHEAHELGVEYASGTPGSSGSYFARGLPPDPLMVGREEQKVELKKALTSWLPIVVGAAALFFFLSKRR